MGRIRTIKPEFFDDGLMLRLPLAGRHAYVWLWTDADDAGRVPLDAYRMKRGCLSCDPVSLDDCRTFIAELISLGRLIPYEVDGQKLAIIEHFPEHQIVNPYNCRPSGAWHPAPPSDVAATSLRYRNHVAKILAGCLPKHRDGLVSILWPYPDPVPVAATSQRQSSDSAETEQRRRCEDRTQGTGIQGTDRQTENTPLPPASGGDPSATAAGRETSAPPDPEPEVLEVEVVEDETQAEPAAPDEKPKRETEPERPAYVPEDAWTGFLAHRRRRRLPVVGRAGVLLANKLARWHKSGLDVGALLDEATLKGWLSPVDPAERGNGGSHRPAPSSQRGGAELLLERLDAADAARGRLL
jgi:hypothetical protein